jgi:hypothetical protein
MFHKIIYSYDSEETDPNFVSFIADDFMDNNKDIDNSVLPDTIPVLPLRNTVIFPGSRQNKKTNFFIKANYFLIVYKANLILTFCKDAKK